MSNVPIKMDLDPPNNGPQAPSHIPRIHDWDWATLRQHPLRDFETVKTSHELTMSHLKDFQDILYGKKCFVLQDPENKNMTWGSVANNCISQSLQRKGPGVVGQSEDFQNSACLDWIKTVQGLKAGLFKSHESDEGGTVYRGNLKGCQVEISATEMALMDTFSMENSNVPSSRDQRMELEIRRTILESSQELARQVKDSYTIFLDFNTGLEQSCKDLELNIQMEAKQSKSRSKLPPNPRPEKDCESMGSTKVIIDLTQERCEARIDERHLDQPDDVALKIPDRSTLESIQQSKSDMEDSLHFTPRPVATKNGNLTRPSHPSQVDPLSSRLQPASRTFSTHSGTVLSSGRIHRRTSRPRRLPTPISSRESPIRRSEAEKGQAVPFVQDLLSQGLNFEQIREPYKVNFEIWRTAASLATYHSQNKGKHLSTSSQPLRKTEVSPLNPTPSASSDGVGVFSSQPLGRHT